MFFNFLVNLLHLEELEGKCDYVAWYEGSGAILGGVIPFLTSLLFVILFYYVWGKFRAVRSFHWCFAGFVNIFVAFLLNLFIGRASLANYITEQLGDEGQDLWYAVITWPFTTDLWIFALNGIVWCVIFYFILSICLKHWSSVWNIPFGKKHKSSNN